MGGWRKTPVALLIISAIDAQGRTLMSAWIETQSMNRAMNIVLVALSRVRGLKHLVQFRLQTLSESHSHECVD